MVAVDTSFKNSSGLFIGKNRAKIYLVQNKYSEAVTDLSFVLDENPGAATARLDRVKAFNP